MIFNTKEEAINVVLIASSLWLKIIVFYCYVSSKFSD